MGALVSALEDAWKEILDGVLRRRGTAIDDVGRLGPAVAELSRAYNAGLAGDAPGRRRLPLEARIAFSFPRDVPKGAGAVRELVSSGLLRLPEDRPLRVLDLGAGLGAITWGVVRALEAAGARGRVEAVLVDEDAEALAAAEAIAREAASRRSAPPIALSVTTRVARVGARGWAEADLVLVGQVLSELDTTLAPAERVERHAALLGELLRSAVAPGGALVVIEPALRDRTRHLHAVRDHLLAARTQPDDVAVFAPCLHERPCPALAAEGEWCHEDLPVDLPPWVVPLARAAGLRFQGLTFSALVLRRDGRRLAAELGPARPRGLRLRVVSERIATKGKSEIWACTEQGERRRLRRLDRDASAASEAWDELGRGDVIVIDAPEGEVAVDERGRVGRHAAIDVRRGRH